jgi:opacity protein-like surface antigen
MKTLRSPLKPVIVSGVLCLLAVAAFAAGAAAPAASKPPARKIFLRLGAGYGMKSFDYSRAWSFDLYGESGHASERYAVDASGVTIDAGIGFMFTPSLGVEVSFVPASGKSTGTFDASFPHPFYFDAPREKSWADDGLKYSSSELNVDVLYAFPVMRTMNVYVFAGGTYFPGVKVESLKSLNWSESGYPYLDLTVTPQYATYSASAVGFNGGAGLDFRLSPGMAVNLNARYSSASAKVKIEGGEVTVPAGGLRATLGLKFGF